METESKRIVLIHVSHHHQRHFKPYTYILPYSEAPHLLFLWEVNINMKLSKIGNRGHSTNIFHLGSLKRNIKRECAAVREWYMWHNIYQTVRICDYFKGGLSFKTSLPVTSKSPAMEMLLFHFFFALWDTKGIHSHLINYSPFNEVIKVQHIQNFTQWKVGMMFFPYEIKHNFSESCPWTQHNTACSKLFLLAREGRSLSYSKFLTFSTSIIISCSTIYFWNILQKISIYHRRPEYV